MVEDRERGGEEVELEGKRGCGRTLLHEHDASESVVLVPEIHA